MTTSEWISLAQVISTGVQGLALVVAAILAYRLGRGAAREDRLRENDLQSIADTREQWLDLASFAVASGNGDRDAMQRINELIHSHRYARSRQGLIAGQGLVDLICRALPALLDEFPRPRESLRRDLSRMPNVVREAMFDQEQSVLRTGQPRPQTTAMRAQLDRATERMEATLRRRYRGWGRARLIARVILHI